MSGERLSLELSWQRHAAIAEFGAEALRTKDLQELLQRGCVLVSAALGIGRVKVLEVLPGGDRLLVRAGVGWGPEVVGRAVVDGDIKSPAGFALKTAAPAVTEDLWRETRFEVPDLLKRYAIQSAANVIIRGDGPTYGVLEVDSQRRRSFDHSDIVFLQSSANLIAAAIDRLRMTERLERLVAEKQVLLYELQHRVKNNLQEVTALVSLQRRRLQSAEAKHALDVLGSRLEALSVVYRKLYLADHHTEVDLGAYLAELLDELFAFHSGDSDGISKRAELSPMQVELDRALPLGLIVCEFVVNSFKYAFPDRRGAIEVELAPLADGRARLTLADNGIGLPASGTGSGGMGMQLIEGLVRQINGSAEISGSDGVRMNISFTPRIERHAG